MHSQHVEECRSLLQEGTLYFVQGGRYGLDAILLLKGKNQFEIQANATIRKPTKNQKEELRKRFEETKTVESTTETVILLEHVMFTSLWDATCFVFGHVEGNEYHCWNLKKQYLMPVKVIRLLYSSLDFSHLPLIFRYYFEKICGSCIVSFIKEIPSYCNTGHEIVMQLLEFLQLYNEYFDVFRKMTNYFKTPVTYKTMIEAIKEEYLNDNMYVTYIGLRDEKMREEILQNLVEMQGKVPECDVMKYIYHKYLEIFKEEVTLTDRVIHVVEQMTASVVKGALNLFHLKDSKPTRRLWKYEKGSKEE